MSQQEDDLRALAKIMDFLRAVSIILVVMNVYWFCYEVIRLWGVNIGVVDRILLNFDRTAGLFHSILYTKLFAVLLLALSCLGTKGVKGEKITWGRIWTALAAGSVLFFLNWWILALPLPIEAVMGLYVLTIGTGYVCLLMGGLWMSRLLKHNLMEDVFNNENESFMQETRLIESEYSVNLPTRFYYKKRWNNGWINVVNPFRASIVLGTPGSGKSYAVVNNFIKQQIEKGFLMYVYDFKFSDLSTIAYNHLLNHPDGYKVKPKFYVINFDDPRRSHRCNPIHPDFMEDITDAYESAYTIMLNLNKTWVQKQGDFFVESPIILFASIIWYLKIYQNGKYCTFPHAIEFLNRRYEDIFPILTSYPELENYLSPFMDAWLGGAAEQLMGQIASAKIPLSRMISPQLYWVMSDSEFTLDITIKKKIALLFDWIAEAKAELAKPQAPNLVSLLNAYYTQRKAGAYSQKGKISNLKEMNETFNYLRANGIYNLEDLESRVNEHSSTTESLKKTLDGQTARMKEIKQLYDSSAAFQNLKPVYDGLQKIKFEKPRAKYKAEHEAELIQFYAARRKLTGEFPDGKVDMKKLSDEYDELEQAHETTYGEFKAVRDDLHRLWKVKSCVDTAARFNERTEEQKLQNRPQTRQKKEELSR